MNRSRRLDFYTHALDERFHHSESTRLYASAPAFKLYGFAISKICQRVLPLPGSILRPRAAGRLGAIARTRRKRQISCFLGDRAANPWLN
jgi:hypothetical protein